MERKAIGPVCYVTHEKTKQCTYQKEKGFAPVSLVLLAAYCATAPCKWCYVKGELPLATGLA